jgi:N-acetyl-alpha-D-glucosaminyl L-malate synthase BshA
MALRPLRIGIVCYPTYGGSGAVATELGRMLARRGHTIHFISYARPFRLINDFHPHIFHHEISSESYPLFLGQLYSIVTACKIYDIVSDVGLDLLHCHYALPHAISAWMALEMLKPERRIPTVTTLHGTDITLVGSKPSYYPAVRLGLEKSDALTSVSHWLSSKTCELFSVCEKLRVVYNFVDPNIYRPDNHVHLRANFADEDERIVMHISNFRPVKRVLDVIKVFARICERMPARLILVGDGPEREPALALAEELKIDHRVMMLGNQPNVAGLLPLADLFLFPSDGESFGLAALEAMACEVPVVGAWAGGLPEVVRDRECGRLLDVGDVEGMARASLELLGDEELRRAYGQAGRRRAIEHFASEKILPQYEEVYENLLARAQPELTYSI